ncbi:MAG: outer membrane beta-barrel protein [Luteitalea sp.]|nr:outer membrane beta-barrel protein [Luteitalea sp.]
MMRRFILAGLLSAAWVLGAAGPAQAQVDQVLSVNAGGWIVKGLDGRELDPGTGPITGDVFANNLLGSSFPLLYEIEDFNGGTFGADYLVSVGSFIEVGAGIGYYQRTVPTIHAELEDVDGSDIEMDMKLRVLPITFTGRFFPLSRDLGLQPYVGAGLGLLRWRYSETGEFVDFDTFEIFPENFVGEGTAVGPVVLAGVRFPLSRTVLIGGEYRFHGGTAELDPEDPDQGFFGDEIDLANHTFQVTVGFRF